MKKISGGWSKQVRAIDNYTAARPQLLRHQAEDAC